MSVPSLIKEFIDPKINLKAYKWKTDLMASQKFWIGKDFLYFKL